MELVGRMMCLIFSGLLVWFGLFSFMAYQPQDKIFIAGNFEGPKSRSSVRMFAPTSAENKDKNCPISSEW